MTPRGLSRWRITVPDDDGRPAAGAVPLPIEWGDVHPTDALPAGDVGLESLVLGGVASELAAGLGAVGASDAAAPPLVAVFTTPRGRVTPAAPTAAVA